MSVASTSISISCIQNGATYTGRLSCNKGDVYQYYEGPVNNGAPQSVYPSFEGNENDGNRPVIMLKVLSSNANDGIHHDGVVTPLAVTWTFGGQTIVWTADSNGAASNDGFFELIKPGGGNTDWGIKIMKNIAVLAGLQNTYISAEASFDIGLTDTRVRAQIPVTISKDDGNGAPRVVIEAGDDKFFNITTDGGSCQLVAKVYSKGALAPSANYDYRWYQLDPGNASANENGWVQVGTNSDTLTVQESMIETYGEFMVRVYNKASGAEQFSEGKFVNSDIQGVTDATDAYMVVVESNPDGLMFEAGHIETITLTPHTLSRNDGLVQNDVAWYTFAVIDGIGNPINADVATRRASYPATIGQWEQSGGTMNVIINAYRTQTGE